jgi:hypothetical protein
MCCRHDGFHAILTVYDRTQGVLVYFWVCERCGARLGRAGSRKYRPSCDLRPAARRDRRAEREAAVDPQIVGEST